MLNPHTKKKISPRGLVKLSIDGDKKVSKALDQPDLNERLFKVIERSKKKGKTSHIPERWLTK